MSNSRNASDEKSSSSVTTCQDARIGLDSKEEKKIEHKEKKTEQVIYCEPRVFDEDAFSNELKAIQTNSNTVLDLSNLSVFDLDYTHMQSEIKIENLKFALALDANHIICITDSIKIYDVNRAVWVRSFGTINFHPTSIAVINPELLAISKDDGSIDIWNANEGECKKTIQAYKSYGGAKFLAVSPDAKTLATCGPRENDQPSSNARTIKLWNTSNWECEKIVDEKDLVSNVSMNDIGFTSDGKLIYGYTLHSTYTKIIVVSEEKRAEFSGYSRTFSISKDGTYCFFTTMQYRDPNFVMNGRNILLDHDTKPKYYPMKLLALTKNKFISLMHDDHAVCCHMLCDDSLDTIKKVKVGGNYYTDIFSLSKNRFVVKDNSACYCYTCTRPLSLADISILLEALKTNTSITSIDLSNNKNIDAKLIPIIVEVLKANTNISQVNLRNSGFNLDDIFFLDKLVKNNRSESHRLTISHEGLDSYKEKENLLIEQKKLEEKIAEQKNEVTRILQLRTTEIQTLLQAQSSEAKIQLETLQKKLSEHQQTLEVTVLQQQALAITQLSAQLDQLRFFKSNNSKLWQETIKSCSTIFDMKKITQLIEAKIDPRGVSFITIAEAKELAAHQTQLRDQGGIFTVEELARDIDKTLVAAAQVPVSKRYLRRLLDGSRELIDLWSHGRLANQAAQSELNKQAIAVLLECLQDGNTKNIPNNLQGLMLQKFKEIQLEKHVAWLDGKSSPEDTKISDELVARRFWEQYVQNEEKENMAAPKIKENIKTCFINRYKTGSLETNYAVQLEEALINKIIADGKQNTLDKPIKSFLVEAARKLQSVDPDASMVLDPYLQRAAKDLIAIWRTDQLPSNIAQALIKIIPVVIEATQYSGAIKEQITKESCTLLVTQLKQKQLNDDMLELFLKNQTKNIFMGKCRPSEIDKVETLQRLLKVWQSINIDYAAEKKSDQEANKQKEVKVDKGPVQPTAKIAQASNASKASVPFESKEAAITERNVKVLNEEDVRFIYNQVTSAWQDRIQKLNEAINPYLRLEKRLTNITVGQLNSAILEQPKSATVSTLNSSSATAPCTVSTVSSSLFSQSVQPSSSSSVTSSACTTTSSAVLSMSHS